MSTTHTPGPWHIGQDNQGNHTIIQSRLKFVIGRAFFANSIEENEANAKLIAAAPELLEALKELHAAAWNKGFSAKLDTELKNANAVIHKAQR